ncbi:MAG TPA: OstA-like protein, partial [Candidatus Kapabacteria bacterium]|nr:OstA-like protein [Candidatus Kapabacteria bacterium]
MINFILIYLYLTLSVQQPIELIYADELSGSATPGVEYRKVSGKVHFEQGNVVIKCDIANHFMAENKVELFGNVVITQEDLVLKANSIYYDGNTGIAVSNEKITITDKNSNLIAEKGTYSTKTYIAEFIQNVSISNQNSKITTDKLIHNRKTQLSQCYGNVKVENDSSLILSDYAEHNAQTKDNKSYGKVLAIAKYSNIFL